jgi:hypothetical protein
MIERVPPRAALWLLEHWGSPYHGESLAGDLIEQYQEGRSRAWCWKQVGVAILGAGWRRIRLVPWTATGRILSCLLAETAAVLAVVMLIFGVIALGAGTLTLADTLRGDARQDPLCPSQQRSD